MELTDEQWETVRRFFPGRGCGRRGKGRICGGATHRRAPATAGFSSGSKRVLEKLLRGLAEDLKSRGKLDLTEACIDGSHAGAKKGGPLVGITRRGKATKIMAVADRNGLPLPAGLRVVGDMKRSSSTSAEDFLGLLRLACARLFWKRL